MPELPEVETIKRDLAKSILGMVIRDVVIYDPLVIGTPAPGRFVQGLKQKTIKKIERKAKALILTFAEGWSLVVHLRMTGQLIVEKKSSRAPNSKDIKVVFTLSDGSRLNYNDQRRFGKLYFVRDWRQVRYFDSLGPEPIEEGFSSAWLKENLHRRAVPIKPLLLNQGFVSGIGNIYASEILFAAGIDPTKPSKELSHKEIDSLHASSVRVLNDAIEMRGTSMRNYRDADGQKGKFINRIKVYGRENEECFHCRGAISRIVQSGRSTFYCRNCQK